MTEKAEYDSAQAYLVTVNENGVVSYTLCVIAQDGAFHRFPVKANTLKRLAAEATAALWSEDAYHIQQHIEGGKISSSGPGR